MPYKNIVFVKLEKRLLNDHRWYAMSESAQLAYVKLILLAAETYNRIPKDPKILRLALKSNSKSARILELLREIGDNFPRFKEGQDFYFFEEFDEKTNFRAGREIPGNSPGSPKVAVEKEKEKEKEKEARRAVRAARPTLAELTTFCREIRIPEADGEFYHEKWKGNNFTNGGRAIKDWKATIRAHKIAGYLPSQKTNGTAKPRAREIDKPQPRRKLCEFGCGAMLTEQQALSHPDSCPKFKAPTAETMKAVNESLKILGGKK